MVRVTNLRERVDELLWYHTIDLPDGVVTPGWFDLRPTVACLPWPDVRGKRCLDVGTYDGFLAFELERRGAAEVVAIDINDHARWDWPPDVRATGAQNLAQLAGPQRGAGFRLAAEALDSKVSLQSMSVYELGPSAHGTFDVVVCGSLLLHLRDPLRALEAIRSVCGEAFLSTEEIDLGLTLRHRHKPVARLNGVGSLCQWWIPNRAGHARMVRSAGFDITRVGPMYANGLGAAHPPSTGWRNAVRRQMQQRALKGTGVPHSSLLATPGAWVPAT
jgi:tRNA (mo5U34)-methyltransferase